jgi:hypothetical protein
MTAIFKALQLILFILMSYAHADLATLDLFRMPQATVFRCMPVQTVRLLEM